MQLIFLRDNYSIPSYFLSVNMLAPYQAGGHFFRWRPTFLASTRQPGLIYEFFEANESPYYGQDPIRF